MWDVTFESWFATAATKLNDSPADKQNSTNITLMSKHLVLDKLWFQAMDLSAGSELTAESVSVK